ncbi:MAG TPA: polyprenyl synthetase family protein [Bacteroidales bacterium]|nr:polyprenyl synthetase family protein [Bacteroidales bacterium]
MKKLEEITQLTRDDVREFNDALISRVRSDDEKLNKILDFVFDKKGKQVRAHLVFLSSRLFGKVTAKTQLAAILVQLLHTSTLMHDDVVDDAVIRRGKSTVNAKWKNKTAVLVGDYLFSKALSLATEDDAFDLLHVLAPAVSQMSVGEIIQMEEAGNKKYSEAVYYNIIYRKTAVLISASMVAGAICGGADKSSQEAMKTVGQEAGMAFQIQDDILDITADGMFGKAKGKDLQEKKYTMPLIHALDEAPDKEAKAIMDIVGNGVNKKQTREVIDFIHQYKGIDYAKEKMHERIQTAFGVLSELPQNHVNDAIKDLIVYFTRRKK